MKKYFFAVIAMLAFAVQSITAQDRPLKIVTNHPDFKIKVSRCVANDKTVYLDLVLSNEGVNDVEVFELWACTTHEAIMTYDNEGNIYGCRSNFVKLANSREYSDHGTGPVHLLAGVPMRLSIRIDGVSTTAESIARIDLPFNCAAWGLTSQKPVKISNVPITRD